MKISVRLFGELVRFSPSGKDSFTVDFRTRTPAPEETLEKEPTLGSLLRYLGIPEAEVWMISVNGLKVDDEGLLGYVLNDGDQVMIFAPVMGG